MNQYGVGNSAGGSIILTNPDRTPRMIVLKGSSVASAATTSLFFGDGSGLAAALGLVGGSGSLEMTVGGSLTPTILKKYMQSYALIVSGYNFLSSSQPDLENNLSLIYPCLDGTSETDTLFSAISVSNMQFNPNLLNVNQPFVWTSATALTIPIDSVAAEGTTISYTFTIKIQKMVPYGQLDNYLAQANIVRAVL